MSAPRNTVAISFLILLLLSAGCDGGRVIPPPPQSHAAVPPVQSNAESLAPGVLHESLAAGDGGGVDLIDLDLARDAAHIEIATQNIGLTNGLIAGDAYLPREWLAKRHALAAVNGGYFGKEDPSGRKEFIGLLVQHGKVRRVAPPLYGHGGIGLEKGYYVRSAFGLTRTSVPHIAWVATDPASPGRLAAYPGPMPGEDTPGTRWVMDQAVGCGPALIARGHAVQSDRQERLVSEGARPRTFVAYDFAHGKPRHFVLGIASGADYQELGRFLIDYFTRAHQTKVEAAMCVDGGASTQLSYRFGGTVFSPRDTGVAVPDAILIVPNKRRIAAVHDIK